MQTGTQGDSPPVPPPPLPLTRRQPGLADCAPGQARLGHGTFVGGCVCCGSGGCSVVPIGSSNRGLVTPQPEGRTTRGGEEGMREGPGQAVFSNSGPGRSQAASAQAQSNTPGRGLGAGSQPCPEASGKRGEKNGLIWTQTQLCSHLAVGPASAASPQHTPFPEGLAQLPDHLQQDTLPGSHLGSGTKSAAPVTCPLCGSDRDPVLLCRCHWGGWKQPGDWGRHHSAVPEV